MKSRNFQFTFILVKDQRKYYFMFMFTYLVKGNSPFESQASLSKLSLWAQICHF